MVPDVQADTVRRLEEENQRLKRAVQELSVLNELASDIGASLDSEHIMSTIIRRSLRSVRAEQGVISLVDRDSGDEMKTLVRTAALSDDEHSFHLESSLLGWVHLNKRPLIVNDPKNDARFRGVVWESTIRSVLCVPLLIKSELTGVLTVYNKIDEDGFTEGDQRLLAIVAAQSAQVVDNARLYEEEQAFRRVQEELALAADIQLALLPDSAPEVVGYDIAGATIPAQQVGGDYFDFVCEDPDAIAFCVGDVSGKGLTASLLMANLQATVRSQALMQLSPAECLTLANRLLSKSTDPDKFATLFYGVLDTQLHRITYANAGHFPPLVVPSDGKPSFLGSGGIVLGFIDPAEYEESALDLQPGDVLVVYSDGITEAVNADDDQFEEERLAAVVAEHSNARAASIVERIMEAVRTHAGECEQSDDMTVIVVKREKA